MPAATIRSASTDESPAPGDLEDRFPHRGEEPSGGGVIAKHPIADPDLASRCRHDLTALDEPRPRVRGAAVKGDRPPPAPRSDWFDCETHPCFLLFSCLRLRAERC